MTVNGIDENGYPTFSIIDEQKNFQPGGELERVVTEDVGPPPTTDDPVKEQHYYAAVERWRLALQEDLHQPITGEKFCATIKANSFLNPRPIRVNPLFWVEDMYLLVEGTGTPASGKHTSLGLAESILQKRLPPSLLTTTQALLENSSIARIKRELAARNDGIYNPEVAAANTVLTEYGYVEKLQMLQEFGQRFYVGPHGPLSTFHVLSSQYAAAELDSFIAAHNLKDVIYEGENIADVSDQIRRQGIRPEAFNLLGDVATVIRKRSHSGICPLYDTQVPIAALFGPSIQRSEKYISLENASRTDARRYKSLDRGVFERIRLVDAIMLEAFPKQFFEVDTRERPDFAEIAAKEVVDKSLAIVDSHLQMLRNLSHTH